MVTRRMFLKTGGSALLVAGTAGAWWAGTRTPIKALAPWKAAGQNFNDPRLNALAYAVLAPNPHNRQPWQIELKGSHAFNVYCDLERRLPHTDPYDRQITIGLGCFLELFTIAAKAAGFEVDVSFFPDGEPEGRLDARRVAHVVMKEGAISKDPLFDHVFTRRSSKEPFDITRTVNADQLAKLTEGVNVGGTINTRDVEYFRELGWKAHEVEMATTRTMMESVNLMRFGKAEVEASPDGIDFTGVSFELMNKTGLMTRENVGDPTSTSFNQGMQMYKEIHFSTMGYVWVKSAGNSRVDQLLAGREWIRLNLQATAQGLAVHPISQALQEYPEMEALYNELHERLGANLPTRIQMFARIGYGPKIPPSPRWALKTRLVNL